MENVIENHYGALRFVENVILRFLVDFPDYDSVVMTLR